MNHPRTIVFLALLTAAPAIAGDLVVHPTRVVFAPNQRTAQVDLTNTGAESAIYRIHLEEKLMTETGEFVPAPAPKAGELSVRDIVQFSPRQVELAPGAGQTVRLALRKPPNLAPGEYRVHMVFSRLPAMKGASIEKPNETSGKELGITLTALIGVSIPVIVRQGETSATATLSMLKLQPAGKSEPPTASFRVERAGNQSLYGDVNISWVGQDGSEVNVATATGMAVYTSIPFRTVKLALRPMQGVDLSKGALRVRYREKPEAGGKLLAEASVKLP